MHNHRVVVAGIGIISPNGIGVSEFWQHTLSEQSGIRSYAWGKKFGFHSHSIGEVAHFSPDPYKAHLPGVLTQARQIQFARVCSMMAIADSGLNLFDVNAAKLSVVMGTAVADAEEMEKDILSKEWPIPRRTFSPFSAIAHEIAYDCSAKGPVLTFSTGCTAGLDALGYATYLIRKGIVDVAIVGASESPLCPLSVGAFEGLGALSTRNCPSTQASCPYDAERDGFVLAEGCGVLILESQEHAEARKAKLYAEIVGFSSTNNTYHMTDLPEDGEGLAHCIHLSLEDAQIEPSQIAHISAHGSSTVQNDLSETNAYKKVFREKAYQIPINSLKSMTGHSLSASNTLEVIALCLEMKYGILFPSINIKNKDTLCDLNYVSKSKPYNIPYALKTASGFSGIHSSLVLKAVYS